MQPTPPSRPGRQRRRGEPAGGLPPGRGQVRGCVAVPRGDDDLVRRRTRRGRTDVPRGGSMPNRGHCIRRPGIRARPPAR